MRGRRLGRAAAGIALLGMVLGCSVLVHPEQKPARCQKQGQDDPCPPPLSCRDGLCLPGEIDAEGGADADTACAPVEEICGDGLDNDCDGDVDEGFDRDGDGVLWCGNTRDPAATETPDCDDNDATVHPGAAEICDGRDNDCDGAVDEVAAGQALCAAGEECVAGSCRTPSCLIAGSSAACGIGERCEIETQRCVPGGCDAASCPGGSHCDITSGQCATAWRPNGSPCTAHGDCASGSCIEARALGLFEQPLQVCGQACCSDAQCAAGERCFASRLGARSCLPVAMLPQRYPAQCTHAGDCAPGEVCAATKYSLASELGPSEVVTHTCTPAFGDSQPGQLCLLPLECATLLCVSADYLHSICSTPCGTSTDCDALGAAWSVSGTGKSYCRISSYERGSNYLPRCTIDHGETGNGGFGAPCQTGLDCADGACVDALGTTPGRCSPTCCQDAHCPARDGQPSFCRPRAAGDHYEMRCAQ